MIPKINLCYPNSKRNSSKCNFTANPSLSIVEGKTLTEALSVLSKKVERIINYSNFQKEQEEFLTPMIARNNNLDKKSTLRIVADDKNRNLEIICYNKNRDSWTPISVVKGSPSEIMRNLNEKNLLIEKIHTKLKEASNYLFEKDLNG